MRFWLLTSTTYGTWLPGDIRGSVTSVRDQRPTDPDRIVRFEHDLPGEEWESAIAGLRRSAIEQMKGPPIYLTKTHAEAVLVQFQETASFRQWMLHALAIMLNHFHIVVEVSDDPDPKKVLADFKAYASRRLNQQFGKPISDAWWTTNGSKRKLRDEPARLCAEYYVLYKQPNPLVVWSPETGRLV